MRRDARGAGCRHQGDHAEDEAEIADSCHQESFDRSPPRRRSFAVVADEEVGAQPHDLPPDQQQEEVVGLDHEQHGGGEERHLGGVRRVSAVAGQIGRGVDLHAERHQGDRHRHQGGEPVGAQVEAEGHAPGLGGPEQPDAGVGAVAMRREELDDGDHQRGRGGDDRDPGGPGPAAAGHQQAEQRGHTRDQHRQPGGRRQGAHRPGLPQLGRRPEVDVTAGAEEQQHHGQSHADLSRSQGDHEDGQHLPAVQLVAEHRVGHDQQQGPGVEQQLDPDQHEDRVAPGQHAVHAGAGQHGDQHQDRPEVDHGPASASSAARSPVSTSTPCLRRAS